MAVLIWDPGVEKGTLSHSLCSWELKAIVSGGTVVTVCVSIPKNIIPGKQAPSNIETAMLLSRPISYRWFPVGGLGQ